MSDPVFHLAIVDRDHNVLLVWPTVTDAHHDLAALMAEHLFPGGRREDKKRAQASATIRGFLLELQQQTVTLTGPLQAAAEAEPPPEV